MPTPVNPARLARAVDRATPSRLLQELEPRLMLCDHVHDGTMAMTFWALDDDASDEAVVVPAAPTTTPAVRLGTPALPRTTLRIGAATSAAATLQAIAAKASPFALARFRGVGLPTGLNAAAAPVSGPALRAAAASPLVTVAASSAPMGPVATTPAARTAATVAFDWVGPYLAGQRPVASAADAPAGASLPGAYDAAADNYTTAANGMPQLNSLPTAATAVYLDFDGDTTTATAAYDEDGDATTFNAAEQANVVNAWRQIAAYFAMFDTNVTTVMPASTVAKSWSAIGNNISGGYAYVGTFPATKAQAFNNSGDARTRVSGLAHEIGHVFGLQHQSTYDHYGTKTAEYRSAPDTLHGPIMGIDYSGSVHKWYFGHNATNSTTLQDDMSVISAKIKAKETAGGDGYRADDYASALASATPLTATEPGVQAASGIVERMADADAFSFVSAGGAYAINATPPTRSGADLKLEIFDAGGARLATADSAANGQQVSLDLPAGTYYAVVSSHGDYGDQGAYDVSARALPTTGWASADVAPTTVWGSGQYDPATGVFTNAGSGADVWNATDAFHFTYRQMTGDGTLIARVLSMTNTDTNAKAGLEIRDSLAANARHADMVITPANGRAFQYRTTAGGTAAGTTQAANAAFAPYWLKLVRAGNTLTGFSSPDGVTWSQVASTSISLNTITYVGLLTTAHNAAKLSTATFDNVSISGVTPTVTYNALAAPQNVALALPATGAGVTVTWSAVPGATGYRVERSADGVTFATAGSVSGNATVTYTDASLAGSQRYFYRVSATDASGASAPSAVASIVNRPSAVTGLSVLSASTTALVVDFNDTDGETGYRVERSADGGATWTTAATLGANITSYYNTGLTANTSYTFRVTPTSAQGDALPTTVTDTTRLPVTTGLAFDAQAATTMTFHWTAVTGATGYRVDRSTDGTTWTTVGNTTNTTYTDTGLTRLSEYHYRVMGTNGAALGVYPADLFGATSDAASLPAGWATADVGTVPGKGGAGLSSGTYSVLGAGVGLTASTADQAHFTYLPLVGDGQIVARVATVEATAATAQAGIVIRDSLAAGARQAAVALTSSSGVSWVYRGTTSATATVATTTGIAAPYWLKLARVGNVLTGYTSADGATWTQLGTQTLASLSATAYVGLFAASNLTTGLNASTFTNVTVANAAPTISAATASAVTGKTTTLTATAADDHGESSLTYAWAATALPAGVTTAPTFSDTGTNAAKSVTATFAAAGTYQFTVTATDLGGLTATRTVSVTVDQTATTVAVSPSSAFVGTGATRPFTAAVTDQFGAPIATPAVTWSVTAGGGSINAAGVFTAPATAQASIVKATAGSASGTTAVNTVVPPTTTANTFATNQAPLVVSFTFSRDVSASLTAGSLVIARTGTTDTYAATALTYDPATNTATFRLPALPDGDFTATLPAGVAADANGVPTQAPAAVAFYLYAGDATGDRRVDLDDLVVLSNHYGQTTGATYADGDFTGDGQVNLDDLVALANHYGTTLAPPA